MQLVFAEQGNASLVADVVAKVISASNIDIVTSLITHSVTSVVPNGVDNFVDDVNSNVDSDLQAMQMILWPR